MGNRSRAHLHRGRPAPARLSALRRNRSGNPARQRSYPITEAAIAATCTESGWTEHIYCAVCEEVLEPYQTEIPALGHDWGAWETVQEPTCTEEGQRQRACQRAGCGETETETISANGHDAVAGGRPTCTDAGYIGRTICTVCGEVVDPGTPAPALGGEHNLQQVGDIESSSYVNTDGETIYFTYRTMVCTRCGYGTTETLEEWKDGDHAIHPSETGTP